MTGILDSTRDEIAARLRELEPLVAEYRQLEAAAVALDALPGSARRAAVRGSQTASSARRGTAKGRAKSARGRGRPRGSGARSLQAIELVNAQPGITVAELASAMGIKQNYLYRVLPGLAKDKKIVKRGRGWHPTGSSTSA
jgi:hypothetical protein